MGEKKTGKDGTEEKREETRRYRSRTLKKQVDN